nr:RNA-dependent RNA polymerase [Flumine Astrovirus 8]
MNLRRLTKYAVGNFEYLGNCQRFTSYKEQHPCSMYFEEFASANKLKPLSYRYGNANKDAEMPSIAKYDRVQPTPNPVNWSKAKAATMQYYAQLNGSSKLPTAFVVQQLDKTTSSGFPFNRVWPDKNKVLEHPEFYEYLEELWEDLANREKIINFFWTCSVKSEMRPIEKVNLNKLRTFLASPIDFTICSNRLCLSLNEMFYTLGARGEHATCVGMSQYNMGWHRLALRLNRHKRGFALDGKAFDSSVFAQALWDICEMRIIWGGFQNTPDAHRMRQLYHSIINSMIILSNGDVIVKFTGNPSGSNNTVVDNTIFLTMVLLYCWFSLAPPEYSTLEMFKKHVEAALYGDDNTLTVSEEIIGWFNARSIAKVAMELGVEFTAEDDIWEPQPLSELKFLNKKFLKTGSGYYVPFADTDKMLSSICYGTAVSDPRWHLMRSYAIRMEGFWNVELRMVIDKYIHYLWKTYKDNMVEGIIDGQVRFSDVRAIMKTDEQIIGLYLSQESTNNVLDVLKLM